MMPFALIKNSVLVKISLFVIIVHVIIFGWMVLHVDIKSIKKIARPLVVTTFIEQPIVTKSFEKNTKALTSAILKNPAEKKEREPASALIKSKSQSKPKEIKKPFKKEEIKPANSNLQRVLASAQAKLDKIQKNTDSLSGVNLSIPQLISSESHYQDELISLLRQLLRLPEIGEVQIELVLDRKGSLKKVKVIKAESKRNQIYVEKMMPTLNFPSFGHHYSGSSEHTFSIILTNDI